MNDFWPDFGPVDQLRTPVDLLQEQAALLSKKTGGLVDAGVSWQGQGEILFARLDLTAKRGLYSYELLSVTYPLTRYYPVTILAGDQRYEVSNEADYVAALKEVLGSDRTKQIVEAIMAHARSTPPAKAKG